MNEEYLFDGWYYYCVMHKYMGVKNWKNIPDCPKAGLTIYHNRYYRSYCQFCQYNQHRSIFGGELYFNDVLYTITVNMNSKWVMPGAFEVIIRFYGSDDDIVRYSHYPYVQNPYDNEQSEEAMRKILLSAVEKLKAMVKNDI